MIDLSKISGLALSVDEAGMLLFPHTLMIKEETERTLEDMKPFLSEAAEGRARIVYRVWRDVRPMEDNELLASHELRYDITIMSVGSFKLADGKREFYKTAGHYHDTRQNHIGYPEIYEVLSGRGRWLLQKSGPAETDIVAAYLVEAGPGEKILIPPGFGHVTINAEAEPLVAANLIATHFQYDYEPYRRLRGACYRLLESERASMIELEANPRYRAIPELHKITPRKDWFKGYFERLWDVYTKRQSDIQFLASPEAYNSEFFAINRLFREVKE